MAAIVRQADHKGIARPMREAGVVGACRRKGGPTTTRRDDETHPAPDHVDRGFKARAPEQLWVAGITCMPTVSEFLYLTVMIDVYSREIVGWSMKNHLRTELILNAFDVTSGQRKPKDVDHHSDQGCRYTSLACGSRCKEADVRPSRASVGYAGTCPRA